MLVPLLAAGASLVGSLLGQKNQAAINQQNIWAQYYQNQLNQQAAEAAQARGFEQQNLVNQQSMDFAREQSAASMAQADRLNAMALADKEKDRQLQADFAQMGIKWRVEDAERAGVHPLFALGGGGAAYSPSAISLSGGSFPGASLSSGGGGAGYSPGTAPRAVAGSSFASMGQDVSRALLATQGSVQRDLAFEQTARDLSLQQMTLRNELLTAQISKLKSGQVGPSVNTGGFGEASGPDYTLGEDKETERTQLYIGGEKLRTEPGTSDAQKFEDRYGEMSDWIFGPYIMWKDFNYRQSLDPPTRDFARPNLSGAGNVLRHLVPERWRN